MLRIEPDSLKDLMSVPCFEVVPGGGSARLTEFPLSQVNASMPAAFDAIVILGDMQAMASPLVPVEDRQLLGIAVAGELGTYCELGLWPEPNRVLICLTGDLYTVDTLDKRGGTGDILSVYRAFSTHFPNVCAVAGNHDLFGDGTSIATAEKTGVRVLHGSQVSFGGFTVGGICGIAGDNGKVWRNTQADLKKLVPPAVKGADLVLVHEPPKLEGHRGNQGLTDLVTQSKYVGTIASGHVRWTSVIEKADFGTVLNLDGRGIVLKATSTELVQ